MGGGNTFFLIYFFLKNFISWCFLCVCLFVLLFDLVVQHVRSQFSGQGSKLRSLHQKNAPGKPSLTSFNLIRSIRQAFMEDTVSSYCCAVPRGSYSHFIVCNSES